MNLERTFFRVEREDPPHTKLRVSIANKTYLVSDDAAAIVQAILLLEDTITIIANEFTDS